MVNVPWADMTKNQRSHRVKKLWKKAKRVLLFNSLRIDTNKKIKLSRQKDDDEGEQILDNI